MSETWHPEKLNDEHLWNRLEIEAQQCEYWQRRAEQTTQELINRGLLQEYPDVI